MVLNELKQIHDYLSNRNQRTKINSFNGGRTLILEIIGFNVRAIIV